jgi:pyruvate/2-oxoglutarate dehydrogenase complex dihydrolipoamide acyltransferase (E2) component
VHPPPPPRGSLPPINEAGFATAHASPAVRKFARELGVDLARVRGNGHKGRITEDDVKAFVKSILSGAVAAPAGPALPQVPVVDYASFGPVEIKPLTRIQNTIVVQSMRERLCGLGTLGFATAGRGTFDAFWESIASPFEVHRKVLETIQRYGRR